MEIMLQNETEIVAEVNPLTAKNKSANKNDVLVIVLLNKNNNFQGFIKSYELELCGKKMWEWVKMSVEGYDCKTITCTEESDILTLIKPLLDDHQWTFVLYSDTPLIKKSTVEEILSYANFKNVNVLNLTRGYVFKTEYIKNTESILSSQIEYFDEEDFMTVYDLKQLAYATDILKNRILDFHMRKGVYVESPALCTIEADVIIESGTKLFGSQNIRGRSIIGKNCVLQGNNEIIDSIISDNCNIVSSYIKSSRISENMIVGPFEGIIKKST